MANNTRLNKGEDGDVINTLEQSGVKTQLVIPSYIGIDGLITKASAETPLPILDSMPEISLGRITGFAPFCCC